MGGAHSASWARAECRQDSTTLTITRGRDNSKVISSIKQQQSVDEYENFHIQKIM